MMVAGKGAPDFLSLIQSLTISSVLVTSVILVDRIPFKAYSNGLQLEC